MRRSRLGRGNSRKKAHRLLLSGEHEKAALSDLGKYQIPSDKIHYKGEAYESLHTVFNKADALIFKQVYNELMLKHLGVTRPMVIRRYYQQGVFYEIYAHRWAVKKDGKLVEVGDFEGGFKVDPEKFKAFTKEVNEKLGKVYI